MSYSRNTAWLFVFIILIAGCSPLTHFKTANTTGTPPKIAPNKLKMLCFFINRKTSWYGVTDRFYAYFKNIDPVHEYFSKECLTAISINLKSTIDYHAKAKEHGIQPLPASDYQFPETHLLLKRFVDYYPVLKHVSEPDSHYVIMEQEFSIVHGRDDNKAAHLSINMYILNANAQVAFSKNFNQRKEFDQQDFDILVSYRKPDRNNIQKRAMEIYVEMFMKLSPEIIKSMAALVQR